ncbi:MAG TPA: response regulator transcription factor [Anaerolineales bacterium]|nr:response regulator transcription factor [Anaerolineales bacterium]
MIRVVLVAPALALRAGLVALLSTSEEVEVIAEGAALADMLPLPAEADILLLAASSASLSELRNQLQTLEAVGVLFLVSDGHRATRLAAAGLSPRPWGILPLECSTEELMAALHALQEGLITGTPSLLEPLFIRFSESEDRPGEALLDSPAESLTEREAQVLQLLAQGLANKQIAVSLGISEHTVKFHISSVYSKLGVASRTEAVRQGVRQGLVIL